MCFGIMSAQITLQQIEQRLRKAEVRIAAVLSAAEIDRSTWSRWRAGKTQPRLDRWQNVLATVDRLTREVV